MPRNRTTAAQPAVDVIKQLEAGPEGLGDFARGILEGVADALDFAAGHAEGARVHTFPVRQAPAQVDVRAIRTRLGMPRREFAARFGFSVRTIEAWENGQREPEASARAFLRVIEREPDAVERALNA
jgi:putative transcriptional regulator